MGNSIEVGSQRDQGSPGAANLRQTAGGKQGVKEQAAAQVQTLVEKTKTTVQDRVRSAAMSGKTQAVETVSGLAQSLLLAGQQLPDQQSSAAQLVEQTAERLDRVAEYLENTQLEELVQRTETWARKNPALFVGGAFLVGILGARFLKSSRPATSQQSYAGNGTSDPFTDREVTRPAPTAGV